MKRFERVLILFLLIALVINAYGIYSFVMLKSNLHFVIHTQKDFDKVVFDLSNQYATLLHILKTFILFRNVLGIGLILITIYALSISILQKKLTSKGVFIILAGVFSAQYLYILKSSIFTLQTITLTGKDRYTQSLYYLLHQFQNVVDLRYLIYALIPLMVIFTILALVMHTTLETSLKIAFGVFIPILLFNIYIKRDAIKFRPLEYMVLSYETYHNGNIHLEGKVDIKKVNDKYIDPEFRLLYLKGVNFENEQKDNFIHFKVSYDVESIEDLDLRVGRLDTRVKIDENVKKVNNINDIQIETLYQYLDKYAIMYDKSVENLGIYEENDKYYIAYSISRDKLGASIVDDFKNDRVYVLRYLGSIYAIGNKVVGVEKIDSVDVIKIHDDILQVNDNLIKVK